MKPIKLTLAVLCFIASASCATAVNNATVYRTDNKTVIVVDDQTTWLDEVSRWNHNSTYYDQTPPAGLTPE